MLYGREGFLISRAIIVDLLTTTTSVTRLGNLLDLGNFLKPLATINFPKSPIFFCNFCKGVKIFIFLVKLFMGNMAIFFWSHWVHHLWPSVFSLVLLFSQSSTKRKAIVVLDRITYFQKKKTIK